MRPLYKPGVSVEGMCMELQEVDFLHIQKSSPVFGRVCSTVEVSIVYGSVRRVRHTLALPSTTHTAGRRSCAKGLSSNTLG